MTCVAAHLQYAIFSHLQVHKISSHTSHKCLYSEEAPEGVFLMHQEGSGLGVVLWVTKNHQQASIASWQVFKSSKASNYIQLGRPLQLWKDFDSLQ